MALHLIKLSVGIDDIEHLRTVQSRRLQEAQSAGHGKALWHRTRHMPRRANELLDGGSIYWVIKGAIRVRQGLRGFKAATGEDGDRRCRIILDPALVPTEQWPRRPFQGWRYLEASDAPSDIDPAAAGSDMPAELVAELRASIPALFESDEYRSRREGIEDEVKRQQEEAFEALQEKAQSKNIALIRTPAGLALAPTREGEVVKQEAFERLAAEDKKRIAADIESLQEELQALLRHVPEWERDHRERLRELNREMTSLVVAVLIEELQKTWAEVPVVGTYLNAVRADVIEHADAFLAAGHPPQAGPMQLLAGHHGPGPAIGGGGPTADGAPFRRYQVNALIAHDDTGGAPVEYEDHPTVPNLMGRIEHVSEYGALITDFTLIKPGALHRANGGYLLIDARRLLIQPFAWEELKRTLRASEIRIQPVAEALGLVSTVTLEPEPIPLDVKIVLIGDPFIYYLLSRLDPDFQELFKVPADFADHMPLSDESVPLFAQLVGTIARREKLKPLDRAAVARVVRYASRIAGDAERLSTHMDGIADLLREADYWAGEGGREVVAEEDVSHAIDAKIYRSDRVRELIQEQIQRGTMLIDTDGEKVGQVNGLSVLQLDSFAFGRPSRITARVRLGRGRVVDIEREVELGGPLHSKGVLILSSYLGAQFAVDRPLSLAASLVFEQSYGGVDGDSASSAELYALLSALAEAPIRQSLAVTGSVNQLGQIQAIGGANEKIEGFFDICAARGLTGDQGVLIPAANVKHLMLRDDVIEACATGRFHVYPVETVDQGIALLTGAAAGGRGADGRFPKGSVNARVEARLAGFAEQARAFARPGEANARGGSKGGKPKGAGKRGKKEKKSP